MLTPSDAIQLLRAAATHRVDLHNEQPHLPNITLASTIEMRAAELIEHYQRRVLDLLEANNRYLERARKAEAAFTTSSWLPIATAPRDGSHVWLWNKHADSPWYAPQIFWWSTEYSIFGLGGCWTDGCCTMGDVIDFDFWCATLPAHFVNPYETNERMAS